MSSQPRIELSDPTWRIGLVLITAIAAAIRLHALDRFSYGLDEILQSDALHGTWSFLWAWLRFDAVHPPLDYVFGRLIEPLHPADWTRKLPDVLWGTTTVAFLGMLVAHRAGRKAGLFAALLLAFAPFHVRYSQELRPYALGILLLVASLLALDRLLLAPTLARAAMLYAAMLATLYTLYLSGVVLGLAAAALLAEDAFSADPERRRRARRYLRLSPLFAAALTLAYLPWIPIVLEAARRPPLVPAPDWTWERLGRTLSFFAFAHDDGDPFSWRGAVFLIPVIAGLGASVRTRGLRVFAIWTIGGLAAIEILGRLHPHWYATRRFLPAGPGLVALAAIGMASITRERRMITPVMGLLAAILASDLSALDRYFTAGRADWRPLARFLAARPEGEWVFTENQYTQLCLAYYLVGPSWGFEQGRLGRRIPNLEGETVRLTYSWRSGTRAWLVTGGNPPHAELRTWASQFPSTPYPSAEGAVLYALEPARREAAFTGERALHP